MIEYCLDTNVCIDLIRGLSVPVRRRFKEAIDEQKEKIYASANQTAKGRVKASFLFNKIAEKEAIKVEQTEVAQRINWQKAGSMPEADRGKTAAGHLPPRL